VGGPRLDAIQAEVTLAIAPIRLLKKLMNAIVIASDMVSSIRESTHGKSQEHPRNDLPLLILDSRCGRQAVSIRINVRTPWACLL
jgi:hypothetical protein